MRFPKINAVTAVTIVGTLLSAAGGIATTWAGNKRMNKTIAKEVAKFAAKQSKNVG